MSTRNTGDPQNARPPIVADELRSAAGRTARPAWSLPASMRSQLGRLSSLDRRLPMAAPVVTVAAALLLMAGVYYVRWGFERLGGGVPPQIAYMDLGRDFAYHIGAQNLSVAPLGYDGQFAYYLAIRPNLIVVCAHNAAACPLDVPLERIERIFYPISVWALALGQPALVPFAMFLIDFVAILVTVVLVGHLCLDVGASRWLGAAAGLFGGEILGLLRDLADPYAVMWTVLAVWCLRKQRPLWGAAAVGVALLTREQLLLFLPPLFLLLVAQRCWVKLAWSTLIAGVPFLGWQVVMHGLYGHWALTDSAASAPILPMPFAGLWEGRAMHDFPLMAIGVGLPTVAAFANGLLALRMQGLRGTLLDPVPLIVLLYCFLISLTSFYQWQEMWAPARLAAPGLVLGILVASRMAPSVRGVYGTLLALSVLSPLFMVVTHW